MRQSEPVQHSLTAAYDLWLGSWETALAALATAIQGRALSTAEAAARKSVIAAERDLVIKQLTLLLGQESRLRRLSDDLSINPPGSGAVPDKPGPAFGNSEVHW